ncbi:hypothetical protein C8R45DRAFT_364985 [Mycena sanguinolenta]|nr:hypothetical protein C8R45DRAFT_364985 [Mycena sanguinolenta]
MNHVRVVPVATFVSQQGGQVVEIFTASKEAAILVLPEGATRVDLRHLDKFRECALMNANRWYEFINGELGRMVDNGELYLVTGTDAAASWSIAAVENEFENDDGIPLDPVPTEVGAAGNLESMMARSFVHSGPRRHAGEPWTENQTVFLRGFKVAVRSSLEKCTEAHTMVESGILPHSDDIGSRMVTAHQSHFEESPSNVRLLDNTSPGAAQCGLEEIQSCASSIDSPFDSDSDEAQTPTDSDFSDEDGEWTEYFPGISKPYHPLSAVNEHLLDSAPDATVAVTHDNEWMSMLTEDDQVVPEASELIQRICDRYSLVKAPGMVWLQDLAQQNVVHKNAQKSSAVHNGNQSQYCPTTDTVQKSSATLQASQVMSNCPPPSKVFYGRQDILNKMHQFFTQDMEKQKIYVLHGVGGAGKTQIALKFIQESTHFTDKFFVDASSTETIETALKNLATAKQIRDHTQDTLTWLASKQENWLMFFDNADDPKINLGSFFANCIHGNIIVTTRNPGLQIYGGHSQVGDMEESDAVPLLLESAGQGCTPTNEFLAAEIVKELAYLPLAVVQAGAFILKSGSLETFLNVYQMNRTKLLERKLAQSHDNYAWPVYTTWEISFGSLSKLAATFLLLCSFLHRDGITEDIFSRAANQIPKLPNPAQSKLQKSHPSSSQSYSLCDNELANPCEFLSHFQGPTGEWDSFHFADLMNEIKAYSLISFNVEGNSFSIHPLVHSWSRAIQDHPETYYLCMNDILGLSIMELPAQEVQPASLRLVSHVCFFTHTATGAGSEFYEQFAKIYHAAGQYPNAIKLDTITLEKQMKILGTDHLDTLAAMENLANTYGRSGLFEQAKKLEIHVLEKRRELLDNDHSDTLSAMNNLAITYQHLGQFEQAKELKIVVLEKQRKFFGENHRNTIAAMSSLANTYDKLGKFEEAAKLKVAAVGKLRNLLGDDHLDTLHAMNDLANTYVQSNRFEDAERLSIAVLEKRKKLLGEDHLETLLAMSSLG